MRRRKHLLEFPLILQPAERPILLKRFHMLILRHDVAFQAARDLRLGGNAREKFILLVILIIPRQHDFDIVDAEMLIRHFTANLPVALNIRPQLFGHIWKERVRHRR